MLYIYIYIYIYIYPSCSIALFFAILFQPHAPCSFSFLFLSVFPFSFFSIPRSGVFPKYFNSQYSFAKFTVSSPQTICAFSPTNAVIGMRMRTQGMDCCHRLMSCVFLSHLTSPIPYSFAAVGLDGTWYRFQHGREGGKDPPAETRNFLEQDDSEGAAAEDEG